MAVDVLLIRHGETHGYHGDVGLTDVGEQQARDKGASLAAVFPRGASLALRHAPTARATATAVTLRAALVEQLGSEVGPLVEDTRFDSMQFLHGDAAVESTNVSLARAALPEDARLPDWAAEYDRFSGDGSVDRREGGPIDRWLVSTTLHMEPPQIASYRLWAGVAGLAADLPGATVLVVTHSGPMRAFTAAAFGADQGEPANLEQVAVLVSDDGLARVRYRDREVTVEVPSAAPPWLDPAYLSGARDARPITA